MRLRDFRFSIFVLALSFAALPVCAQTYGQLAPGVREQVNAMLNKPAMVQPATAAPLGKNWFKLETDVHIITDEVTFAQASSVLLDIENTVTIFSGKKSKNAATVINKSPDETVAEFALVTIAPMGIQLKTPYRASVKVVENTGAKTYIEIEQLASDTSSNKSIKNLSATRYAEEVTIDGKTYTYIRVFAVNDVNASILPGAKNVLENNSEPANIEVIQMIIAAAKKR